MKKNIFLKGQGEIFGIALMFVVIVIGIVIYGQIDALSPDRDAELEAKFKYEILAQSSLETILKTSSECNIDGGSGDDTIQDLINVCLARSYGSSDVSADCDGTPILICSYAVELLNNSLYKVFNGDDALVANVPFFLEIDLESNSPTPLNSVNITNFGDFVYNGDIVTSSNYRKKGFKKASSDLKPWATAQRDIKVVLGLYYR